MAAVGVDSLFYNFLLYLFIESVLSFLAKFYLLETYLGYYIEVLFLIRYSYHFSSFLLKICHETFQRFVFSFVSLLQFWNINCHIFYIFLPEVLFSRFLFCHQFCDKISYLDFNSILCYILLAYRKLLLHFWVLYKYFFSFLLNKPPGKIFSTINFFTIRIIINFKFLITLPSFLIRNMFLFVKFTLSVLEICHTLLICQRLKKLNIVNIGVLGKLSHLLSLRFKK